jgi:hypothetical protein
MIRDMIYLDGGDISWSAKMDDGTTSTDASPGTPNHCMFTLQ